MANLIQLTTFNSLRNDGEATQKTATPRLISVKNILSVKTRAIAFQTTGVTDVIYELPVNNSRYQITLICTETMAAILTAANANPVAT